MVIKKIALKDLVDFANQVDQQTPSDGVLPITRQRALSQSQNPFASPDDTALLVAYDGSQEGAACVGYLGAIPGGAWVNGQCEKVLWLSTWYVSPKARDSGVAMQLLFAACQLGENVMVTGVSESARRVYVALHFREFGPLRFSNYWIVRPGRERWFGRISSALNGIDRLAVRAMKRRFLRKVLAPLQELLDGIECRGVSRIQPPEAFGGASQEAPGTFIRGTKVINWMLEHPWLVESAQASEPRYEFSAFRPVFHYAAVEITGRDTGKYLGYMVMSISRENAGSPLALTLLDWALLPEVDPRVIPGLLLREGLKCEADRITLPSSFAEQLPKPPGPFGQVQEISSLYFARLRNRNGDLSQALNDPRLHYTDGDRAFT